MPFSRPDSKAPGKGPALSSCLRLGSYFLDTIVTLSEAKSLKFM
jgi:hypothetical protein